MNWYKSGEYFVAGEDFREMMRSELYQMGLNSVSRVFFNTDKDYGKRVNDNQTYIPVDNFIEVNGNIREGIRSSIEFKKNLHKITWNEMYNFKKATLIFEDAVYNGRLTTDLLKQSIEAHARVIALVEFNGSLPVSWFREKLGIICADVEPVTFEDFSFCEVMPHRIMLRWAKLKLLNFYLKNGRQFEDDIFYSYLKYYSHYDPVRFPLNYSMDEEAKAIKEEIRVMAEKTNIESVKFELHQIRSNRLTARDRYYDNLNKIACLMHKRGCAKDEILNFVSALSIISLAATEEEYRHMWQDRFWRALGIVVRALGLPENTVSLERMINALKLNPCAISKGRTN